MRIQPTVPAILPAILRRIAALIVLVSLSAATAAPSGAAPASAPASAPDGVCEVFTGKIARPTEVYVGQEVEIVLTVDGRCPDLPQTGGKADIVLVIDRSSSQRDNGTWEPTVLAASLFVDLIDFSQNQVGVVAFERNASLIQPLSSDAAAVRAAIQAIPAPPVLGWSTNITAGVNASQAELTSPRHRTDATPVLVLLSDGKHSDIFTGPPLPAANAAKQAGTLIITIGLGADAAATNTLRSLASKPELYFPAPTADDLADAYRQVAGAVATGSGKITGLEVYDLLPPEVAYVDGSAVPPPSEINPGELIWRFASLPSGGWTARYRVRALVTGTYATNKLAYVDFLDGDGSAATRDFPEPRITVTEPPERQSIFLPILYHGYCKPVSPFDVVLVVDTSSSMWGEKLARTRDAARDFLRLLEMPPSQAGVVAFNAEATVVQGLTADRPAALLALDNLPRGEGTRIDKGLRAAVDLLARPGRDLGHAPVVVLLTDGQQEGAERQEALNAGAAARRAGVTVFTIGFGSDVDPELLERLAGNPDRFYSAPTIQDLERIYQAIAGALPCTVR
jgi:Mg-chelatase subunit ChlD